MWWDYVQQVAKGAKQADIAERAGVNQVTVSRWKKGAESARPENVAAFARAYGRPVLEAFVAAGFLTSEEAEVRPDASLTPADLESEALVEEIARRLRVTSYTGGGKTANFVAAASPDESGESAPTPAPDAGWKPWSREDVERGLRIAKSNRADLDELPDDLPETARLKERADQQIQELEQRLGGATEAG
ncbi:MAG TPA: helix-turn-helix transcriptional regulator [Nocardioides sp.]